MTQTLRKRKCRSAECRQWFMPRDTMQRACSPRCERAILDAKVERETQRAMAVVRRKRLEDERAERERRAAEKIAVTPLTKLCNRAQPDVNAFIRERDRNRGCISCPSNLVEDAGHYIHAGSKYRTSRLRFDERVIHGQCSTCNRFVGGGNKEAFRRGLVERYGEAFVEELDEFQRQADRDELEPLTKDEVLKIAAEFRRRTRAMRKERGAA